jgi:hypothetical protein
MADTPPLYVCHGDDGGPAEHPCRRVQEALRAAGIDCDKGVAAHGSPIPSFRKGSREELLAATDEASDGPLDRDLADLVNDARVVGAMRMVVGVDLAIIFLMVNKPGWAGSVAVAGTGLALGALLAALASRRTRQPVASHSTAE